MCFLGIMGDVDVPPSEAATTRFNNITLYHKAPTRYFESDDARLLLIGTVFDTPVSQLLSRVSALENAYGTYAYVHCDRRSGRITLGTDKLGYYPLYYHQNDAGILFGNFLPHLKYRLKNPDINMEAWDEILNTGDILGRKTTIKEINRLLCGEKLIIEQGKLRRQQFWRYEPVRPVALEQYIDDNNQLLAEALGKTRNYSPHNLLPLTGGQDSRRLAVTAGHVELNIQTLTQQWPNGQGDDVDSPLAQALAAQLGVAHRFSPIPATDQLIVNKLSKDYWLGFESNDHAWAIPMTQRIHTPSLIYDGIIGDVTINGHYFRTLEGYSSHYRITERVVGMLMPASPVFPVQRRLLSASLGDRVRDELANYPADINRLVLYKLCNHTRRNIGSWHQLLYLKQHGVCLPFGYFPLFLQSLALAPGSHNNQWVQGLCIERINKPASCLPSTRDPLCSASLQRYQVQRPSCHDRLPKKMKINKALYSALNITPSVQWLDRLAGYMNIDQLNAQFAWRTEPLKRMSLFLEWLATDESKLPVLFTDEPPFLKGLAERYQLAAQEGATG